MAKLRCTGIVLLLILPVCEAVLPATSPAPCFVFNERRHASRGALAAVFQTAPDTLPSPPHPRSALFPKEAGAARHAAGPGWFWLGLYVLVALVFSGLSGYTAISKGLNPALYFFLGFFLSAFGYLYVLTRKATAKPGEVPAGLSKVQTTFAPVPCPKCGFTNHPAAKKCPGCGAELQPMVQSEVSRAKNA